jgi:hypothetical protein
MTISGAGNQTTGSVSVEASQGNSSAIWDQHAVATVGPRGPGHIRSRR